MMLFSKPCLFCCVIVAILPACTVKQLSDIEPISPRVNFTNTTKPEVANSRTPTFSWTAPPGGAQAYDLIVYDGVSNQIGISSVFYSAGKEVYYREGIRQTTHKIEMNLDAYGIYVWSVRPRNGEKTGNWAKYNFTYYAAGSSGKNLMWAFKIPGK